MAKTIEELRKENVCTRCKCKPTDGVHAWCKACRMVASKYYWDVRKEQRK